MSKGGRFILDLVQFTFIFFLIGILRPLSFEKVSHIGGFLGRWIGMKLPHRKRAYKNLQRAMPELSQKRQDEVIEGMFDNLFRTILEYIVCSKIQIYEPSSRVKVVGQEIIDVLRDDQKPAILFLGHLSNWEIGTQAGLQRGLPLVQVSRSINYPLSNWLIHWVQSWVAPEVIPKGQEGARLLIKALKKGKHIAMLNDQKMREGEWIPFFGMPAKTAAAGARLAIRHGYPFVPVRVERIEKTRFQVTYYPPLTSLEKTEAGQIRDLLTQMNAMLEHWIRERPEQWLWLHRRWP